MLRKKHEEKADTKRDELNLRREELEFQKQKFAVEAEERKSKLEMEMQERRAMLSLLKDNLSGRSMETVNQNLSH